jgi:hypothetical protein
MARIECRESGPKLMWPKVSDEERTIFRRITIVMAASYPVFVLVAAVVSIFSERILAAVVHLFTSVVLPAQPPLFWWQRLGADWPQLLYGPTITLVCVWALVVLEVWVRLRIRRGAGSKSDRPIT